MLNVLDRAHTFVDDLLSAAKTLQRETGIDPKITLLQAAHESNFGVSGLARRHHNLFGMKPSRAWKAANNPIASLVTTEYRDGHAYQTTAEFKSYGSDLESMRDWPSS